MPSSASAAGVLLGLVLAGPLAAQDHTLRDSIAQALTVPTEQRMEAHRWPQEPAIVALYYGADWCAPCHAFVPELKRVYSALRAAGADTEVVYVSLDESEADMRRTMRRQQMPWPAIDYRRLSTLPKVRALGGLAPPNLVLIDRSGNILASAWDGRRYRGLQPVLQAWVRHPALVLPEAAAAAPR